MSDVDVREGSAVEEGISRELRIVERKLEKYQSQLGSFEDKHGMSTEEFLEKFNSGELGDDSEWFDWKFAAEAVKRLEKRRAELEKAV
jgi:prefoldin subunit 5